MITDFEGLRAILERLPMGVLFVSVNGDIILSNDKAPELLGVDSLDLLEKGMAAIPSATGIHKSWESISTVERREDTVEFARARRSYSAIVVQGDLALFGQPCIMILVSDVTEVEQHRELRENVMGELLRRIRGPLTSVKTALAILASGKDISMSEAAREVVGLGDAEVRRLSGLIGDMSEMLNLEGGLPDGDLYLENVDLRSAIQRCVRSAGKTMAGRGREIRVEADGDGPWSVIADYEKLRVVLDHLLSNALVYSEASAPVRISVCASGGGEAEIRIDDAGVGISPEDLPHIFGKFFRSSQPMVAASEGTGLGLFISKSYAELMGGTLHLDSAEGRGTTAVLRLPIPSAADWAGDRGR